jgi:cyclophilin family peptidyl-prolyl cis-trans isomerase/HEAT repeat protein
MLELRRRFRQGKLPCAAALCGVLAAGCGPGEGAGNLRLLAGSEEILQRVLETEDSRSRDPAAHFTLLEGISWPDPEVQRIAVRALGRQEDPSVLVDIGSLLESPYADIRVEAVNASAQAVAGSEPRRAMVALMNYLPHEREPEVRGAVLEAMGRLSYQNPDEVGQAYDLLLQNLVAGLAGGGAVTLRRLPHPVILGGARALENLIRTQSQFAPPPPVLATLAQLAGYREVDGEESAQVRRLALAGLVGAGRPAGGVVAAALADEDAQVRRLAVLAIGEGALDEVRAPLSQALADTSHLVRVEAVRALSERVDGGQACAELVALLQDPSAHVALEAIDRLAGCPPETALAPLDTLVLPADSTSADDWHRAAHGLVALAAVSPFTARRRLPAFSAHRVWQMRMYAARAAARLELLPSLLTLAGDEHWNVRQAAIAGLAPLVGHDADSVYLDALGADDPQLVLTASRSLAGSEHPGVLPAAFDALERMSADQRETHRDVRLELLQRIRESGSVEDLDRVQPYMEDYDPVVARIAEFLRNDWTGSDLRWARPSPPERAPMPTLAEMREMAASRAVIRMAGGGEIVLELLPFESPANTARFVRLAREGYFDGLTFHRVVPNFVIQGGSPGANEYHGDGPYTRDELTMRSHVRGTVGISTRGRDTGDGQIFVNLVDNPRLDHNYTIIARVVEGMEVVDGVLEGAVMEQIAVVEPDPQ